MAYDHALADRVRDELAGTAGVVEKAMFGGIAFLLNGNLAVGVANDDLMVRVGPDAGDEALEHPHARVFDMTGRPMKGWILVAPEGVAADDQLADWVGRGLRFAGSLPPKT